MTASIELKQANTYGDEALKVVDRYRAAVHDRFRVDTLDNEFPYYSRRLGSTGLYLARAGDNDAGAFKWRGAMNGAVALQKKGASSLVVPSAGNHARGAVLAARELDMDVRVVVPETAPPAKKEGLRELWDSPKFQLHTVGNSFDESLAWALEHPEHGELLHPYDNAQVAAGQGTVVDDLFAEMPVVDHIVLPVGGGGLLAGVLNRLRETSHSDSTTVHAVEADGSNSLSESLARNQLTAVEHPNDRYGGSAVRQIGNHALAICRNSNNLDVLRVSDQEVDDVIDNYEQSRNDTWRNDTPNYEPTTLVAIAGLAHVARNNPNQTIVVIGTGHNDSLRPGRQNVRPGMQLIRNSTR